MFKAVLFDLDGVIVDSEVLSSLASDKVLSEIGIVLTPDERSKVFGKRTIDNYRNHIEARGLDLNPQELVDKKNELFKEVIKGRLKPLPGVLELLKNLEDAGVKTAVVSSSPLVRVEASLVEVGLFERFPVIISGDCCREGKPNPEPFLLATQRFGVEPEDCLVVEDAEAGILAGKSAGMKCLAVRSPNTHGQDLSKADVIIDSLEDVSIGFLEDLSNA